MGNGQIANSQIPLGRIMDNPHNYVSHPESQIEYLRASLRQFGQVRSLVVQDRGNGAYELVAGHGVCEAARREGLETLRADVLPANWSRARVLAYLAVDNESARMSMPDQAQYDALVELVAEADAALAEMLCGVDQVLAGLADQAGNADDGVGAPDAGPGVDAPTDSSAHSSTAGPDRGDRALFPLAIVLTRSEYDRWVACRERLQARDDKTAALTLVGIAEARAEVYGNRVSQ